MPLIAQLLWALAALVHLAPKAGGVQVIGKDGLCASVGEYSADQSLSFSDCSDDSQQTDWQIKEVADPRVGDSLASIPQGLRVSIEARLHNVDDDQVVDTLGGVVMDVSPPGNPLLVTHDGVRCFDTMNHVWSLQNGANQMPIGDPATGEYTIAMWMSPKVQCHDTGCSDRLYSAMYQMDLEFPDIDGCSQQAFTVRMRPFTVWGSNGNRRTLRQDSLQDDTVTNTNPACNAAGITMKFKTSAMRNLYDTSYPLDGWSLFVIRGKHTDISSGNGGTQEAWVVRPGESPRQLGFTLDTAIHRWAYFSAFSDTNSRQPGYLAAFYQWHRQLSEDEMLQLYDATVGQIRSDPVYPFHIQFQTPNQPFLCWQAGYSSNANTGVTLKTCDVGILNQHFRMDGVTTLSGDSTKHFGWIELDNVKSFLCLNAGTLLIGPCDSSNDYTFKTYSEQHYHFDTDNSAELIRRISIGATLTWSESQSFSHQGIMSLSASASLTLPAAFTGGTDGFTLAAVLQAGSLSKDRVLLNWGHEYIELLEPTADSLSLTVVEGSNGWGLRFQRWSKYGDVMVDKTNDGIWPSSNPGGWMHLAITCDGTKSTEESPSNGLKVYIDSVVVISADTCSPLRPAVRALSLTSPLSSSLDLDSLDLYQHALTPEQVEYEVAGLAIDSPACTLSSNYDQINFFGSSDDFEDPQPMLLVEDDVWEITVPYEEEFIFSFHDTFNINQPRSIEWGEVTPLTGRKLQQISGASFEEQTTFSLISGGDPGEGVDLQGDFHVAIDLGNQNEVITKAGEAAFISALADGPSDGNSSTLKFELQFDGTRFQEFWVTYPVPATCSACVYRTPPVWKDGFGGTDDDEAMDTVMSSAVAGSFSETNRPTMEIHGLKVGAWYKLQLLHTTKNPKSIHDIFVGDTQIATDFQPAVYIQEQAGTTSPAQSYKKYGVNVAHIFSAEASTVVIRYTGQPYVAAITVENIQPAKPVDATTVPGTVVGKDMILRFDSRTLEYWIYEPVFTTASLYGHMFARFSRNNFASTCVAEHTGNLTWSTSYYTEGSRLESLWFTETSSDDDWNSYRWGEALSGAGVLGGWDPSVLRQAIPVTNPDTPRKKTFIFTEEQGWNETTEYMDVSAWLTLDALSSDFSDDFVPLDESFSVVTADTAAVGDEGRWRSGLVGFTEDHWGIAQMAYVRNTNPTNFYTPATYALLQQTSTLGNFQLSLKMVTGSIGGFGVIFRFEDTRNFYGLIMVKGAPGSSTISRVELYKVVGGTYKTLCETSFTYLAHTTYDVVVQAVGPELYARFGSSEVCAGTEGATASKIADSAISTGYVGFFTIGTTASAFLDIILKSGDGSSTLYAIETPEDYNSAFKIITGSQAQGDSLPLWEFDGDTLGMGGFPGLPSIYSARSSVDLVYYRALATFSAATLSSCELGLAFHVVDQRNYYAITTNREDLYVWQVENDQRRVISTRPKWQDYFSGDKEYKMQVVSMNSTTLLFIDGWLIDELYDITQFGTVGFLASTGNDCGFSDLDITVRPGCGNGVVEPARGEECDGKNCENCQCIGPSFEAAVPVAEDCVDVDECARGIDDCGSKSQCINLVGTFGCGPYLNDNSLSILEGGEEEVAGTLWRLNSTAGGKVQLEVYSGRAGIGYTDVRVYVGPESDPTRFECKSPLFDGKSTLVPAGDVVNVVCDLGTTVGEDLQPSLRFCVLNVEGCSVYTSTSDPKLAAPLPTVTPSSLGRPVSGTTGQSQILGQVASGEEITFTGTNFVVSPSFRVLYGPGVSATGLNTSADVYECAVDEAKTDATTLYCFTQPNGQGAEWDLYIFAGDTPVRAANLKYGYPTAPIVEGLSSGGACVDAYPMIKDCPTLGGFTVTIHGDFFSVGTPNQVIFATSTGKSNPVLSVQIEEVTVALPEGNGVEVPVIVSSNGQTSLPMRLLSFARPSISSLAGCAGSSGDTTVFNCASTGEVVITIMGENFGPGGAKVLIGGVLSASVVHAEEDPHKTLVVKLPGGTGINQRVTVLQDGGLPSQTDAFVDYLQCKTGFEPSGLDCVACEAGKANSIAGSECKDCPVGTFSPDDDNVVRRSCTPCLPGSAQDLTGQVQCTPCTPGRFAPVEGRVLCSVCPTGRAAMSSSTISCPLCPAGKYQDTEGQDMCLECPVGYYTPTDGQAVCLACDAGTYSDTEGTSRCGVCAAGFFSAKDPVTGAGATECTACRPGEFQAAPNQGSCSPCPVGEFSQIDETIKCNKCAEGTFASTVGLTTCESCLPGFYANTVGQSLCLPCDSGFFAEDEGSVICEACDKGYFSFRDLNNTGDEEDVKRIPGATSCTACPRGQYTNAVRQAQCTVCEAGFSANTTGTPLCDACRPGQYQNLAAQAVCKACAAGTYAPAAATVQCLRCSPGTFADMESSTNCTKCPPGFFQNQDGRDHCLPCQPGTANAVDGQIECLTCSPGFYSGAEGMITCDAAPPGSYQSLPNKVASRVCPVGTYSPSTGFAECIRCETGKFNNLENQTSCFDCPGGTFQGSLGQTGCLNCTLGEDSPPSADKCKSCVPGTIAPTPGTANCLVCPPDSETNKDQTECLCRSGTFLFQGACDPCPEGTICVARGVNLLNIEAQDGYWQEVDLIRPGNETNMSSAPLYYRCAFISHCEGGVNSSCAANRRGPVCSLCREGYEDITGSGSCIQCPDAERAGGLIALISFIFIFCLGGLYWFVLQSDRKVLRLLEIDAKNAKERETFAVTQNERSPVAEMVQKKGLRDFDHLFYFKNKGFDTVLTREQRVGQNYLYNVKVLLGFLQILTNITTKLDMPWPSQFVTFINYFSFLNFDIVPWEAMNCAVSIDYYTQIVVTVAMIPCAIAFTILFVGLPGHILDKYRYGGERGIRKRRIYRMKFWKLVIFTLFLIYPNVSSTILRLFQCRTINGVSYMMADMSLTCYTSEWDQYMPLGVIAMFVYPLGIPSIFFYFLSINKYRLWTSPKVMYRYALLYQGFHPLLWWFEMVDMIYKLFMTSIVGFFTPAWQIPVALIFVWGYTNIILRWAPHVRKVDDRLQQYCQAILLNLLLLGYTMQSTQGVMDPATEWALSILMILMMTSVFSLFIFHGVHLFRKKRKWKRRKKAVRLMEGDHTSSEGAIETGDVETSSMNGSSGKSNRVSFRMGNKKSKKLTSNGSKKGWAEPDEETQSTAITAKCSECGAKKADVGCVQCQAYFCISCFANKHSQDENMERHQPVTVKIETLSNAIDPRDTNEKEFGFTL